MISSLTPVERESLVTSNLKFAWWFARRYQGKGVPYDDLRQEAILGLCEAVARFDSTFGANIRTFAAWYIMRNLKRAIASNKRFPGTLTAENAPIAKEPVLERQEAVLSELWDFVESLPETDQQILVHRFGLIGPQWTLAETAARLHTSVFKIRKSTSRSLKVLSQELREIA